MPRKLDLKSITAVEPGSHATLEPGAKLAVITGAEEVGGNSPRVNFELEVVAGPDTGKLKGAWDSEKTLTLWDNENNDANNAYTLGTIAADNPGFDPEAAWNSGNLDLFVGKQVGVVFREEEYFSGERAKANQGVVRTGVRPWKVVPRAAVQAGEVEVPALRKLSDAKAKEAEELRRRFRTGEFANVPDNPYGAPAGQFQAQQPAQPQAGYVTSNGIPF